MQVGDSFREKKKKKKTPLVIRFSLPNAVKLKFLAHHASIFPEWKRAPKVPVVRTTFFQRPSKTRELTGLLRVDEKLELIGLCNQEEKNEARPAGSSCIEMQVFSLLSRSPWAVINRWKKNKEGEKMGFSCFPWWLGHDFLWSRSESESVSLELVGKKPINFFSKGLWLYCASAPQRDLKRRRCKRSRKSGSDYYTVLFRAIRRLADNWPTE